MTNENNSDNKVEFNANIGDNGIGIKAPQRKRPFWTHVLSLKSQKRLANTEDDEKAKTTTLEEEKKRQAIQHDMMIKERKNKLEILNLDIELTNKQNQQATLNYVQDDFDKHTEKEQEQFINQDRSQESEDIIRALFNDSSKSSEEHFHMLYAKLILGEIKTPKSVSKKTLNIVSNLSTDVIKIFKSILPYVISVGTSYIILNNERKNIEYVELFILEDSGLIQIKPNIGIDINYPYNSAKPDILKYWNYYIMPNWYCDTISTSIILTNSAIQLYKLLKDTIQQKTPEELSIELQYLFHKKKNIHNISGMTYINEKYNFVIIDSKPQLTPLNTCVQKIIFPIDTGLNYGIEYIQRQEFEYQAFAKSKQQGK